MKDLKEISARMSQLETIKSQREFTEEETSKYNELCREFSEAERNNNIELQERQAAQLQQEPKKMGVGARIREAINKGEKSINLRAVTTASGSGAAAIETEVEDILEPLYSDSVLAKAGAKFYQKLPMGNVTIPVLGKGTVAWAAEAGAASDAAHTFTGVTLTPKRLTAFVDISKALINQDTKGAEAAIQRDLYNAIVDKLEATVFGTAAGSATQPAGLLYNATINDATTFAKLTTVEEKLDEANVGNNRCYILSAGSKADLRAMAKAGNAGLVYQSGEVDGTPGYLSGNVGTNGTFVYGDFSNLAVGAWGDIEITVDPFSQAANGCVRLVVNAYFDVQKLRDTAFAVGRTRTLG